MRTALFFTALLFVNAGCSSATEPSNDDPMGAGAMAATGGFSPGTGGATPGSGGTLNTGGTMPGTGAMTGITGGAGGTVNPGVGGTGGLGTGGSGPSNLDTGSRVMTWVPAWDIQGSKDALQANFDGMSMKDGLSLLGLQFWRVNGGSTELDTATPADVEWFRQWGEDNGVGVLLCVHNVVADQWNWWEAVNSFQTNREAFTQHLLSEVDKYNLDGIDLDLEGLDGSGIEAGHQETYRVFAQGLAEGLHAKGKVLHLASFAAQWHAPNATWWAGLLPFVDGIESMGYEQSGMSTDYAAQVNYASVAPSKLLIGVPGYHGQWLGHTASEHVGWLVDQGQVGVAIWAAMLRDNAWRQSSIWQQLATVKAR